MDCCTSTTAPSFTATSSRRTSSSPGVGCSLLTARCSLLAAHCSLLTAAVDGVCFTQPYMNSADESCVRACMHACVRACMRAMVQVFTGQARLQDCRPRLWHRVVYVAWRGVVLCCIVLCCIVLCCVVLCMGGEGRDQGGNKRCYSCVRGGEEEQGVKEAKEVKGENDTHTHTHTHTHITHHTHTYARSNPHSFPPSFHSNPPLQCEASHGLASSHVGTPLYMAPEVYRGSAYTAAVDVWAMGRV